MSGEEEVEKEEEEDDEEEFPRCHTPIVWNQVPPISVSDCFSSTDNNIGMHIILLYYILTYLYNRTLLTFWIHRMMGKNKHWIRFYTNTIFFVNYFISCASCSSIQKINMYLLLENNSLMFYCYNWIQKNHSWTTKTNNADIILMSTSYFL